MKLDTGFQDFYEAYGRKVSRKAAVEVWKRKRLHEKAAEIIAAAKVYAAGTEERFRKHPERWLRGEGWLDSPPLPESTGGAPGPLQGKAFRERSLDGSGRRVVHPDGMAIPYNSPLGDCFCNSCKKARGAQVRA